MQSKWWTLITVNVAVFMLLLDITVVNVALPDIERSLDASFTDLQWVVDAYTLGLAALLLAAGSLADRLGRRRVFVAGLGLFTIASLLCALAGSPTALNLARALQGLGGAAMFATSLALLAQEFSGPERGTAFGVWGATTGGAVAVGPLVGGALTESLGWESIFLLNLPIGIAAVVLTLRHVRESSDPQAGRLDLAGTALFSAALLALVLALIRGNDEGWGSALIVGLFATAALLLLAFVMVERRRSQPMLDLSLFRISTFTGASAVAFALSASMFAMFLYITLYLQGVLGYSPLEAGMRFLPITLLSFLIAPIAGRLSSRLPARGFLAGGLALVALGLFLMSGLDRDSSWTALLPGFVLAGAGIGLVNPPLASTAIGVVEPRRSGMASGINSTFRQVGIATGIAALGAVFQARIESRAGELLVQPPETGSEFTVYAPIGSAEELGQAISSGAGGRIVASAPPEMRETLDALVSEAFVSGLNTIFLIAAAVAAAGALLAFALVRSRDIVEAPHAAAADAAV